VTPLYSIKGDNSHVDIILKGDNNSHFGVMVFNTTSNNISVISSPSVLLVEETGVPGENHRAVTSHWQTLSHNVVLSTPCHEQGSNSQL